MLGCWSAWGEAGSASPSSTPKNRQKNRKCRARLMSEQAKSEESNRTDHPATDHRVVATAAAPGNESLSCTATHPTVLYRSNSARCYAFKRLDEPRRLAFGPGQKERGSAGPTSLTSQRPVRHPPRAMTVRVGRPPGHAQGDPSARLRTALRRSPCGDRPDRGEGALPGRRPAAQR